MFSRDSTILHDVPRKVLKLSISIKSLVSVIVLYILWLQQLGCSGNHVLMYQSQSKKSSLPSMHVHELRLERPTCNFSKLLVPIRWISTLLRVGMWSQHVVWHPTYLAHDSAGQIDKVCAGNAGPIWRCWLQWDFAESCCGSSSWQRLQQKLKRSSLPNLYNSIHLEGFSWGIARIMSCPARLYRSQSKRSCCTDLALLWSC